MRYFLIGCAIAAPIISIALAALDLGIVLALAPLFVSHLLLLYPTLVPNSQWWGSVVTHFQTDEREVWMTIDDGPSPAHTSRMLQILERFDARATFFVVGERAEKFPHLITEILARGHTVANHTHTHPSGSFWCASPRRLEAEIGRCAETLRSTPERPPLLFRAPVGMKNPFVHPVLARRGMMLVGWSVRGFDTIRRDAGGVAERIEKRAKPGGIILLHEGQRAETDSDFNPRCLEMTLQRLAARDFRFVIPKIGQLRS